MALYWVILMVGLFLIFLIAILFDSLTIKFYKTMAEHFNAVKATLENISKNIDDVRGDVAYLKDLAQRNEGGFTAEQVTELSGIVDGLDAKLAGLAGETDVPVEEPEEPVEPETPETEV